MYLSPYSRPCARLRPAGWSALACLLMLGVLMAAPAPSSACTCGPGYPLTPQQDYDQSTAVFTGRVLSIEPLPFGAANVEFQIYEGWKGVTGTRMVLYNDAGSFCGYEYFQVGGEYLVYARGTTGSLSGWQCGRTTTLDSAGEDLDALGPPAAVPTAVSSWGALKELFGSD